MAKDPMQVLPTRLPTDLVKEVDEFAATERKSNKGVRFSRSDAIRMLIYRGLEAEAEDEQRQTPPTLGQLVLTIDLAAAQLPHTVIPHEPDADREARIRQLGEIREQLRSIVHELGGMNVEYSPSGRPVIRVKGASLNAPKPRGRKRKTE